MELELIRDTFDPSFTLGELKVDGKHFGYTCEDCDRKLEETYGGENKVFGETAIPRGRYRVETSYSTRFKKILPILIDVPYFIGIRIHGGNDSDDTHGCPLLGLERTLEGVKNCAERVATLTNMIEAQEEDGKEVWITIS